MHVQRLRLSETVSDTPYSQEMPSPKENVEPEKKMREAGKGGRKIAHFSSHLCPSPHPSKKAFGGGGWASKIAVALVLRHCAGLRNSAVQQPLLVAFRLSQKTTPFSRVSSSRPLPFRVLFEDLHLPLFHSRQFTTELKLFIFVPLLERVSTRHER